MVTKCANPDCNNVFRYLKGGKLFLVDMPPIVPTSALSGLEAELGEKGSRDEYFWLCEKCALSMTLTFEKNGHKQVPVCKPVCLTRNSR